MRAYAYGFPHIGKKREYKRLIESYWNDKIEEDELLDGIHNLENEILSTYKKYVNLFPIGELTLYDNMLDTALMFGLYKYRNLHQYFEYARGKNALKLTKWFNTNYHYLVPEIKNDNFRVVWNKLEEAKSKHPGGIPYIIGPFTFLKLSNLHDKNNFASHLLSLSEKYRELTKDLGTVHIDEPAFTLELSKEEVNLIKKAYEILTESNTDIYLFTYYESIDSLLDLYQLKVKGIGLDFVHSKENLENIRRLGFPEDKILIAGLVDGRNVWRTDISQAVDRLKELSSYTKNLMVSNAAPLYHLPITTSGENIPKSLLSKLAFAEERLYELNLIVKSYNGALKNTSEWTSKIYTKVGEDKKVREKIKNLREKDFTRSVPYSKRRKIQKKRLNLPEFPTTTIGSFPQTKDVRKIRRDFRMGNISRDEYKSFIRKKIKELIKLQEDLGLDVLVHGEFERTDMVEFFAKKLNGIQTTRNGWIISYGTRGYRPPIIYGDISRQGSISIEEIRYAQSLTKRPVKGMLTGPITMIAWSYVREDIPVREVAYELSLFLQDEIRDYERNGIKIVQIDEPAFRERAPIKKRDWGEYFDWAVKSFRLASSNSKPETQIHSHMCYSEFGEIIEEIMQMDFDVISIEATRSKGAVIQSFEKVNFDRQLGLGVWDVHSPRVPSTHDMRKIVNRALTTIPKENFWINPDCGLKTRKWKETIASLKNLVELACQLRKEE